MPTHHCYEDRLLDWQSYADQTIPDRLQERCNDLREWLLEHAPDCDHVQAHLTTGTPERAYWHYGYAVALRDVLALLKKSASPTQR